MTSRQNRSRWRGSWCALLALLLAAGLPAQMAEARDVVFLTNGKELRGRIVRIDDKEIVLRQGSKDRAIPRAEVRNLRCVASEHSTLLADWQSTDVASVEALLALAVRADEAGLPHETKLLRWYAALVAPTDAAIHTALGNRRQGERFLVSIDGDWVPFDKADALGTDFDKAWRLRSEHFSIECAGGLRAGLDALMELEGLYHACHELFGGQLSLLEIVEPIPVRLYRERKQMPSISNNVGAYFDGEEPALYTCLENNRPFALMHEGTHALLHFFFVRAAKSRGSLPAWLDEGWAEYLAGRVTSRAPGKVQVLDGSVQGGHRQTLQAARKDDFYSVHRLLNFKAADFQASSHQDLKYAQSWALFTWLHEHPDAAVQKLFATYLRSAAAGQGQASTFRQLFARMEQKLETDPWK